MFQVILNHPKLGRKVWCNDRGMGYWGDPARDSDWIQYMSKERADKVAAQLHGKVEPKA